MFLTFCCPKCDFLNPPGHFPPLCGTGTTWGLLKCPGCKQLFAYPYTAGFVPDEVVHDPEVEVVEARQVLFQTH